MSSADYGADYGLLAPVWAGRPVATVTGDAALVDAMIEAELALARAQGVRITPPLADAAALAAHTRAAGNPVPPLLDALGDQRLHHGATSQDILDTALMLTARRALTLAALDLDTAIAAATRLARAHRDTPMAARTLTQQAVPTTFGLKAAGWRHLLLTARRALATTAQALPAQLGGAAGTLASFVALAENDVPFAPRGETDRGAEGGASTGRPSGSTGASGVEGTSGLASAGGLAGTSEQRGVSDSNGLAAEVGTDDDAAAEHGELSAGRSPVSSSGEMDGRSEQGEQGGIHASGFNSGVRTGQAERADSGIEQPPGFNSEETTGQSEQAGTGMEQPPGINSGQRTRRSEQTSSGMELPPGSNSEGTTGQSEQVNSDMEQPPGFNSGVRTGQAERADSGIEQPPGFNSGQRTGGSEARRPGAERSPVFSSGQQRRVTIELLLTDTGLDWPGEGAEQMPVSSSGRDIDAELLTDAASPPPDEAAVQSPADAALALVGRYSRILGLTEPLLPWHVLRAPIADLASSLALASGALGKVAADVLVLARSEVGEVSEGVGGVSSTMPHKANPVRAVLIAGAARQVPALASVLFASVAAEDERPAGAWHAEWQPLREALRLVGGSAATAAELLGELRVHPERMAANLASLDLAEAHKFTGRDVTDPREYLGAASALVDRALKETS